MRRDSPGVTVTAACDEVPLFTAATVAIARGAADGGVITGACVGLGSAGLDSTTFGETNFGRRDFRNAAAGNSPLCSADPITGRANGSRLSVPFSTTPLTPGFILFAGSGLEGESSALRGETSASAGCGTSI